MTAPTATHTTRAAPATTRRVISRDELVRLARSAAPWDVLPLLVQAASACPGDTEIALLAVRALARLGLVTPARELLEAIPAGAGGAAELAASLPQGEPDALPASRRIVICRANVAALAARGVDVGAEVERWAAHAGGVRMFRATDGNVVRRSSDGAWVRLRNEVGEAKRIRFDHRPGAAVGDPDAPPPQYIEGLDPPWAFQRIFEATPPGPDGYAPPITVVQAGVEELLDGLSLVDLRRELADPRVRLFVGADASARLLAHLRGRSSYAIRGEHRALPTLRQAATPPVAETLATAVAEQAREHERLVGRVEARYAGRDRAWWARRFGEAQVGGAPLRVLVPTCRYTTFVRHSAEDLVAALGAAGCDARLVIEPDDHTRLASLTYLRAFDEFEPDLVVLVNYTRAQFANAAPLNVPFVCWIQDAMAHLFDPRLGAAQGDLDFLAGNIFADLTAKFGYPAARTMLMPVVASARKFHPGPVADEARSRFACEIAYVGHQSETPEAMRDRLALACGSNAAAKRAIAAMFGPVQSLAHDAMRGPVHAGLTEIVRGALRAGGGGEPDDRLVSLLMTQAALPLADRMIRHQTLAWAADAAERRGWRLRVFGRGWGKHPRFGRFAQGAIEHGDDLRACYQTACAHLHVSINALLHQRVLECALSGGLPLCRLHFDELYAARTRAWIDAFRRAQPSYYDAERGRECHPIADHPELMRFMRLAQLMDQPTDWAAWKDDAWGEAVRAGGPRDDQLLLWLLADASETTFRSAEELERRVERAVERPRWRENAGAMIRRRALDRLTHDVFARRLIGFVREALDPADPSEKAA